MNKLVVVNICIFLLHIIFILVNLTTAKKGLRDSSSCRYSGGVDKKNDKCHKDKVKIRKLPEECSAFIIDGVKFTRFDNTIIDRSEETILVHLKELIEEDDSSHDVYLFYHHNEIMSNSILYPEYFQAEAKALKDFIGIYAIKGLILDEINHPFVDKASDDFYKIFKDYVTTIKTENPGLEIGFYLGARTLITEVERWNPSPWFDFGQMNDILDFYVIEFWSFNFCTDVLLRGGITPFDSSDPDIMTLNRFLDAFKKTTIDKEKVYFEFLIMPVVKPENGTQFEMQCEKSYNEYCENYDKYKSIWCVDTQDMLVKKGQFSKTHSKGFIARDIDAVDRDEKCNCPSQYVTFFMMLNGYNGDKNPMTCDKLQ